MKVDVFKDYFGELEEESIRDNFVIIYELLDETMDFGYPQTMESKILREYITQASVTVPIFVTDIAGGAGACVTCCNACFC